MAVLVTLELAKSHLRITGSESNADVYAKAEQASDIVLDYLKTRFIAIASISEANPSVVTTSVPHSLTTGDSVLIAGTTSTPTIVGAQVVTVTSQTTFTVPVNVTSGQTDEAGTVGRPSWTTVTVPKTVQYAVLAVLEDLYEHRPIDWVAVGSLLMRFRDPALA